MRLKLPAVVYPSGGGCVVPRQLDEARNTGGWRRQDCSTTKTNARRPRCAASAEEIKKEDDKSRLAVVRSVAAHHARP